MKRAPYIVRFLNTYGPVFQTVSLILVVVALLYSHRETSLLKAQLEDGRTANKRAYTFDLLSDLSENSAIADANYAMVRLINAGVRVGVDESGNPRISNTDELSDLPGGPPVLDDRNLVALLNFYELIATAYAHGAIDHDLLLEVRGGPMRRAHELCSEYIEEKRKILDAPFLYSNFSALVEEIERSPDRR